MKAIPNIIIGLSIALTNLPCFGQGTPLSATDTLTVLTFNLYGRPESQWSTRLGMILDELENLQPDLVAFQEVIEPGGQSDVRVKSIADSLFVRTGISYRYVYERTHFAWDMWYEGIAILSPHILLDSEAVSLPPGLFPRSAIWVRALTPAGIIDFFNTHLSFGNQESVRKAQVAALRTFVSAKGAGSNTDATILGGDFNSEPDAPPVLSLTNPDSGSIYFDSWDEANPGQPGWTMPSDNPSARIDYLFVKGDDNGQIVSSELVLKQANANGLYPSDHVGVQTTLRTTNHKLVLNLLSPLAGEEVTGQTTISWSVDATAEPVKIMLYLSDDAGQTWQEEWAGESADNSYLWNTLTEPDGARYLVRIAAVGDTSFGITQSAGTFTVNNPGNAPPEIELLFPRGGALLRGMNLIKWTAADADGDTLLIAMDLSSDAGVSWRTLATNEANDGSFLWDTQKQANSPFYKLRIRTSDNSVEVADVSEVFTVQNDRPSFPESLFAHVAGTGDGRVQGSLIDSTRLTSHLYRITFDDTLNAKTTYDIFDTDKDSFVVQGGAPLDGVTEGPAFDGLRLIIFNYAQAQIDRDSTGWTVGPSTLDYSISTPTVIIGGKQVQSFPYPADYRIRIFDSVVDSTSTAFGFAAKPIKFMVRNLTENRDSEILFTEFDNNQTVSDLDKITILEPDSQGELQLTWAVFFRGGSNHVPPAPDDEFTIKTLKPFTSRDVFEFRGSLPTSVFEDVTDLVPSQLTLYPNYPNPFNPSTTIQYYLSKPGKVKIAVYNLLGQEINILSESTSVPGLYAIVWDGKDSSAQPVSSGVYVLRIESGELTRSLKITLLK